MINNVDNGKLDSLWEYTGFGATIGPLNLRAGDCPNIVFNEECHTLTCIPRWFPLGTLGMEPISDGIIRAVHK